jgi:hypothetical protein
VIAKINDPVRATAYAELGIATLCRTGLMMDAVADYLGLPKPSCPACSPRSATTRRPSRTTPACERLRSRFRRSIGGAAVPRRHPRRRPHPYLGGPGFPPTATQEV